MDEQGRKDAIAARAAARAERAARRAQVAKDRETLVGAPGVATLPPPSGISFTRTDGIPLPLNNVYLGAPCFIILSGPSILDLDLSQLQKRGIFTIGVNNSPSLFRPNAWTSVDPPEKFHDAIWRDPAILKFAHQRSFDDLLRTRLPDGRFARLKHANGRDCRVREMPGVVGYNRNANFMPETWLSEPTVNWGNSLRSSKKNKHPRTLNTMFAVIKIAYLLGFRAVYLLGCDFHMRAGKAYAFSERDTQGKDNSNNGAYEKMNAMFTMLKPSFDAAGFHVMNCNPDSAFTVFPICSYTDAIHSATAHLEQSLQTEGWYDRKIDL